MTTMGTKRALMAKPRGGQLLAVIGTGLLLAGCSSGGTPAAAPTTSAPGSSSASSSVSVLHSTAMSSPPPVTKSTSTTTEPTTVPTTGRSTTSTDSTVSGTTAGAAGTDLTGDVYGKIVAVDPGQSQITLDKFDWFTGDAARQACDEDGVQERDNGWCTDYYYRNRNPQLRVVTVSPDATVVTLAGGSPTPVPSDLPTVGQRLSGSESSGIFQITVTDGQVTSIRELYFP